MFALFCIRTYGDVMLPTTVLRKGIVFLLNFSTKLL